MRRRSARRLVCAWLTAGALAASLDASGAETLVARLWTSNDGAKASMTESRFVIKTGVATKPAEEHPVSNYALLLDERERADTEAYSRLRATVKNSAEPLVNGELSIAIAKIDEEKSRGYRPAHQVHASPDGNYLTLAPWLMRPIVVNARTLETHALLDRTDLVFERDTPIAWSSDSRSVAFAPEELRGQIFIYDVDQPARRPAVGGPHRQVVALQWSSDDTRVASLELVNPSLLKTPFGLVTAVAGHPNVRNDLALRVYAVAGGSAAPVHLKRHLSGYSAYDYWIEWR